MSGPNANNGRVVVRVRDQVNRTLAGHGGREYTSPLHERADALTLVALLLGRTRLRALNVRAIREGQVNLAAPLGALTERQRNWLAARLCR